MRQTIPQSRQAKRRDMGTRPRRWTREEYYRAAECGVFQPGERLELLDGEILEKMSPQRSPHSTAMEDTARALEQAFGPGYYARRQLPLVLTDLSEPEPDVVVVPGKPRDYLAGHPTAAQAQLVVEVADSTLRLDRGRKLASYARAAIAEYWIENLPGRRLEVYRDPSGSRYRSAAFYTEPESIAPLAAPHALVRVADLLPPLDQEPEVDSGEE